MTNQEILAQAIEQAIAGGWHTEVMTWYDNDDRVLTYYTQTENPLLFLFNHDFAKALWNAPKMLAMDFTQPSFETRDGLSEWQYHLQQMVIADDPIKYLGDNIQL